MIGPVTDYRWQRHHPAPDADPRRPTIVLLSGLFAGGWIWDATWSALTNGHDRSAVRFPDSLVRLNPSVDSVLVWRSWLFEFLTAARIERPIRCGNSLGGLIVLDFAASFPDLVQAVVTSGAPGMSRRSLLSLGGSESMLAQRLFHDPSRLNAEFVERVVAEVNDPVRFRTVLRALQVAQEYDAAPILANIACPVLFVWGDHDRVSPLSDWLPHLDSIKDCRVAEIKDCGHSPMVEQPEEFNAVFFHFLDSRAR
jgi:pimeloyl-ACP methyl ester carboxylesterase